MILRVPLQRMGLLAVVGRPAHETFHPGATEGNSHAIDSRAAGIPSRPAGTAAGGCGRNYGRHVDRGSRAVLLHQQPARHPHDDRHADGNIRSNDQRAVSECAHLHQQWDSQYGQARPSAGPGRAAAAAQRRHRCQVLGRRWHGRLFGPQIQRSGRGCRYCFGDYEQRAADQAFRDEHRGHLCPECRRAGIWLLPRLHAQFR